MPCAALALVALHAAATAAGGGAALRLAAAAGGGHDTNVSHDASDDAAVASDLLVASAALGAEWSARTWFAGAELLADRTELRDVPDLSETRAGGGVAVGVTPWDRVTLTATGTATRSWWGDAAREGWGASAIGSVRLRILPRLSAIGSYARGWNEADDPIYSFVADRLAARAELRVARRLHLRAGYAWSWRDEVFYVPVVAEGEQAARPAPPRAEARGAGSGAGGPGEGGSGTRRGPGGRPVTSSFPGGDREVVKAAARIGTARLGLEVPLLGGAYVDLEASRVDVRSDLGDYDAWVAMALLGIRR